MPNSILYFDKFEKTYQKADMHHLCLTKVYGITSRCRFQKSVHRGKCHSGASNSSESLILSTYYYQRGWILWNDSLLARPLMFACVLVSRLVPLLEKLESSEIATIHLLRVCKFRSPYLRPPIPSTCRRSPCSYNLLIRFSSRIRNRHFPLVRLCGKTRLGILKHHVRDTDALRNIYIHRLEFVPNHDEFERSILSKWILINCLNLSDSPEIPITTSESAQRNHIAPVGDEPRFHIKVFQTPNVLPKMTRRLNGPGGHFELENSFQTVSGDGMVVHRSLMFSSRMTCSRNLCVYGFDGISQDYVTRGRIFPGRGDHWLWTGMGDRAGSMASASQCLETG